SVLSHVQEVRIYQCGIDWPKCSQVIPSGLGIDNIKAFYPDGGAQMSFDINQDGILDISDVISFFSTLFIDNIVVLPCGDGSISHPSNLALLDANGDGGVDVSDAVYMLAFLFLGSPPPVLGAGCIHLAKCPDSLTNCSRR